MTSRALRRATRTPDQRRTAMRRRLLAIAALLVAAATVGLGIFVAASEFPRGLGLLASS